MKKATSKIAKTIVAVFAAFSLSFANVPAYALASVTTPETTQQTGETILATSSQNDSNSKVEDAQNMKTQGGDSCKVESTSENKPTTNDNDSLNSNPTNTPATDTVSITSIEGENVDAGVAVMSDENEELEEPENNENPVAMVSGVEYASFQEAIDDASGMNTTIFLVSDVDLSALPNEYNVFDISGNVLEMNGHTITCQNGNSFVVFQGTNAKIKNGTFANTSGNYALFIGDEGTTDNFIVENVIAPGVNIYNATNVDLRNVTSTAQGYYAIWLDENGHSEVQGGYYSTSSASTALIGMSASDTEMVIKSGTFVTNGKPLVLQGNYGKPVIYDGVFDVLVPQEYMSDGLATKQASDGSFVVVTEQEANSVASIVDEDGNVSYYDSLQGAIIAANYGAIIKMTADAQVVTDTEYGAKGYIAVKNKITIDLNGYVASGGYFWACEDSTDLTIMDSSSSQTGKIDSPNYGVRADKGCVEVIGGSVMGANYGIILYGSTAKINVSGGLVSGTRQDSSGIAIFNYAGGDVSIRGGKVTSYYTAVMMYGGNLSISGGTVESKKYGIALQNASVSNADTASRFTMTGGAVIADLQAICGNNNYSQGTIASISGGEIVGGTGVYWPMGGELDIYDGAYIAGGVGIEAKQGNINVYGGDIVSSGTYYEYDPTGNGSTHGGWALAIDGLHYGTNVSGVTSDLIVNVYGGNFKSDNGTAIEFISQSPALKGDKAELNIFGGTFAGAVNSINVLNEELPENSSVVIQGGNFSHDVSEYYVDDIDTAIIDGMVVVHYHDYVGIVTKPTCETGGYTTYTCSICNDSKVSDETDALEHEMFIDKAVEPTCTNTGLTQGSHCARCGKVFVEQNEINATGHSFDSDEIIAEASATCDDAGVKEHWHCLVCDGDFEADGITQIDTLVIPAKGHTQETSDAVVPTCIETGLSQGTYCSICGEVLIEQEVIDALGHEWGEWRTVSEAQVGIPGAEARVCAHDMSHVEIREIAAIDADDGSNDDGNNEAGENQENSTGGSQGSQTLFDFNAFFSNLLANLSNSFANLFSSFSFPNMFGGTSFNVNDNAVNVDSADDSGVTIDDGEEIADEPVALSSASNFGLQSESLVFDYMMIVCLTAVIAACCIGVVAWNRHRKNKKDRYQSN